MTVENRIGRRPSPPRLFMLRAALMAAALAVAPIEAPITAPVAQAQTEADALFWDSIKDSKDPAEFEAYIAQFPEGKFVSLARIRLKRLQAAAAKPAQEPIKTATLPPRPKVTVAPVPAQPNEYRLTLGADVNFYAEPDDGSALYATARIPRFVRVVAYLPGTDWTKVEYIRGREAYVKSARLHARIDNAATDPNWALYRNKSKGSWFERLMQLQYEVESNAPWNANNYGRMRSWAGVYTVLELEDRYKGKTCATHVKTNSTPGASISTKISALRDVFYIETRGDTLFLRSALYDDTRQYIRTGQSFRMGKGSYIRNDTLKNRQFFRLKLKPHTYRRLWADDYKWFSSTGKRLALALRRARHKNDKVYVGIYLCDSTITRSNMLTVILSALPDALLTQPGMIYHDTAIYIAGAQGDAPDYGANWVALDPAELAKLKIAPPPDGRDHLLVDQNGEEKIVYLENLVDGSSCWSAGCQRGDILLQIGDVKISDFALDPAAGATSLEQGLKRAREEKSIPIKVWRDGAALSITVENGSWYQQFRKLMTKANAGDAEAAYLVGRLIFGAYAPAQPGDAKWIEIVRWPGKVGSSRAAQDHLTVWTRAAAEGGHVPAMRDYGRNLRSAYGVPRDDATANQWLQKAIDIGKDPWAMTSLAHQRLNGFGFREASYEKAISLYTEAIRVAESNDDPGDDWSSASSKLRLAYIYDGNKDLHRTFIGRGPIPRDINKAIRLYEEAAEKGRSAAMARLGHIYREGDRVKKDYARAVSWYEKAVEKRNRSAQMMLGLMYDKGWSVKRDRKRAADLVFEAIKGHYGYSTEDVEKFKETSRTFSAALRRELQRRMRDAGVYTGAIDGAYGPGTLAAVKALSKL